MLGLINFNSHDFLTIAPLHFRWTEIAGQINYPLRFALLHNIRWNM